jgi:serine/threonine-protein phosphatase 5
MICHGGLPSEDHVSVKDIRQIKRFVEPPVSGAMCDILWADPSPAPGRTPSKRGASMGFGPDISEKFLKANNLCTFQLNFRTIDQISLSQARRI